MVTVIISYNVSAVNPAEVSFNSSFSSMFLYPRKILACYDR